MNTSKLILQGHHHPDAKTRQRQHTKKRKLEAKINDEHRRKNPQQRNYQSKFSNIQKGLYTYNYVRFISGIQVC